MKSTAGVGDTTKGEMNYHAAVRGHRQLPDHGGGHSGGPTHSQPSRVATSRILYVTHPHAAKQPGFHISCTRNKLTPREASKKTTHMQHKVKQNNPQNPNPDMQHARHTCERFFFTNTDAHRPVVACPTYHLPLTSYHVQARKTLRT